MLKLVALLALLCACGAAPEAAQAPAEVQQKLSLPVQLADAGSLAVLLWRRAGWQVPQPTIEAPEAEFQARLEPGSIRGCGADDAWGCTELPVFETDSTLLRVSAETPPEFLTSVFAHELGHALGLEHSAEPEDIMNPNRSRAAFLRPCVRWACLEQAEAIAGE